MNKVAQKAGRLAGFIGWVGGHYTGVYWAIAGHTLPGRTGKPQQAGHTLPVLAGILSIKKGGDFME